MTMVITNVQLSKDWIKMSLVDWESAQLLIQTGKSQYKGQMIYHLQMFVEKLLKGLIYLLGDEPELSHFPSKQLASIIHKTSIELKDIEHSNWKKNFQRIIVIARSIKDERTRPRYGIRHASYITSPDEFYTMEMVNSFVDDAKAIANLSVQFLRLLPFVDILNEEKTKLEEMGQ